MQPRQSNDWLLRDNNVGLEILVRNLIACLSSCHWPEDIRSQIAVLYYIISNLNTLFSNRIKPDLIHQQSVPSCSLSSSYHSSLVSWVSRRLRSTFWRNNGFTLLKHGVQVVRNLTPGGDFNHLIRRIPAKCIN